jgi:hypothetical protein
MSVEVATRPATAATADEPVGGAIVKVALASAIGTTIEYYDFTLYATAAALLAGYGGWTTIAVYMAAMALLSALCTPGLRAQRES